MGQTPEGARKAAKTMRKKYGKNHFKQIGSKGGKVNKDGYFSRLSKAELRRIASLGGQATARKFKEDKHEVL